MRTTRSPNPKVERIRGSNTVGILIEPIKRPLAGDRRVIRARARSQAGGEAEKSVMTGFDRDGLTDDGHKRRIALGEVNSKVDRSAKANGRDQVAKAEEVGLGRDREVVGAGRDRAVVEDAEDQLHRRDVNFFLLKIWQGATISMRFVEVEKNGRARLTAPILVRIEVSSSVKVPLGSDRHT